MSSNALPKELKECSACNWALPLSEFRVQKKPFFRVHTSCKKCQIKKVNKRRKENPIKTERQNRKYRLRHVFGITENRYNDLYIEQGGRCAICGIHQSKTYQRLGVDHCHKTKKIRGLLCNNCNIGIGHFNDNLDVLANAIKYIESSEQ